MAHIFVDIEGFRPYLSKPSYRAPKWALMVRLMQKERLKSPQKSKTRPFGVILAILAILTISRTMRPGQSASFYAPEGDRVSHGTSFLVPGSLARRWLARVIHHHHHTCIRPNLLFLSVFWSFWSFFQKPGLFALGPPNRRTRPPNCNYPVHGHPSIRARPHAPCHAAASTNTTTRRRSVSVSVSLSLSLARVGRRVVVARARSRASRDCHASPVVSSR